MSSPVQRVARGEEAPDEVKPSRDTVGRSTSSLRRGKNVPRIWGLDIVSARNILQAVLFALLLYVGWRFFLFVRHFETGGATPFVPRPAFVEGFLPISALVGLKIWILNGSYDVIHPAGLTTLLAILAVSFLWKKGFCSWFCPVGAVIEALGRMGGRIFRRSLAVPRWLDWPLMSLKYLVLLFFVKVVLIDMDAVTAGIFLRSPYNRVADVKMLYFFLDIGLAVGVLLVVLAVISLFIPNFWCRYLCPYGAMLGIFGILSPLVIDRNQNLCVNCHLCTEACPNRIDVARTNQVRSPECTGCLNCLATCPRQGALQLRITGWKRAINPWIYPALLVGSFALIVLVTQISGHWQTSMTYRDYASLIPRAREFRH